MFFQSIWSLLFLTTTAHVGLESRVAFGRANSSLSEGPTLQGKLELILILDARL